MSGSFPDPDRSHLLCLVGGGGDGFALARAFLRMLAKNPEKWNGTLVTGPFLSRSKRTRLFFDYGEMPHIQILRFTTSVEQLIRGSDAVITMGGYNAVTESLSLGRRTLVAPRVHPRREQWLRAQAFEQLGLLSTIDPDTLDDASLAQVVESMMARTKEGKRRGECPEPQSKMPIVKKWSLSSRNCGTASSS